MSNRDPLPTRLLAALGTCLPPARRACAVVWRASAAAMLALAAVARLSGAHEVRPAYLELTERVPGEFDVLWKVPALGGVSLVGDDVPHAAPVATSSTDAPRALPCGCPVPTAAELARGVPPIHPALPRDSHAVSPQRVERLDGAELRRWTIRTGPAGLDGWQASIHGLTATMVDVLVRIELVDGRVVSRLLRPDLPSFEFRAADAGPAASGYFRLGVQHILLGVDHLLFVLCLLLLVRGVGRVIKTVTAFTVAHSITLGLAALGYVHVPAAPVEAVIALSILFLATEIARRRAGAPSLTERQPWLVAFAFGLLHGFGFAGALAEVGLPAHDIPLALALFNVGVEAGQLLFVGAACLVVAAARRVALAPPAWLRPIPAYGIGAVASYWLLARVALF